MITNKVFLITKYAKDGNFGAVERTASFVIRHITLMEDVTMPHGRAIEATMQYCITASYAKDAAAINRVCCALLYNMYPGETLLTLRLKKHIAAGQRPQQSSNNDNNHMGDFVMLPYLVLHEICRHLRPTTSCVTEENVRPMKTTTAARKLLF